MKFDAGANKINALRSSGFSTCTSLRTFDPLAFTNSTLKRVNMVIGIYLYLKTTFWVKFDTGANRINALCSRTFPPL